MHSLEFPNIRETIVIVGTFNRNHIASQSLNSLATVRGNNEKFKVVVVDSSLEPHIANICKQNNFDYVWLPGDVSMAAARNIAYQYAKQKYCYDWVLFAEDDIKYSEDWYEKLIQRSSNLYGKISPNGLIYGAFSASSGLPSGETVVFDDENDCYAVFFGPRADQRLYKTSHYENIIKHWDPDLLGISSCQTGQQISRNAMQGYCSANFSHLNLCQFIDGEESTWVGMRDIGPAAFDKRLAGYKSVIKRVNELRVLPSTAKVSTIPVQTSIPMTEIHFQQRVSIIRKAKRRLRRFFFGK